MKHSKFLIFLIFLLLLLTATLIYGIFVLNNYYSKKADNLVSNSQVIDEYQNKNLSSSKNENSNNDPENLNQNCKIEKINDIVRGNSMSGILKDGQEIIVLKNYYSCYPVKRDDLVIYQYAGLPEPLVKIVKAVPGDYWEIKLADQGYKIIVNGKVLTNSNKEPYQIPTGKIAMLKLYASDYPIIPPNTYLILGNIPSGTLDSSRFGLVSKSEIIGKVIIK